MLLPWSLPSTYRFQLKWEYRHRLYTYVSCSYTVLTHRLKSFLWLFDGLNATASSLSTSAFQTDWIQQRRHTWLCTEDSTTFWDRACSSTSLTSSSHGLSSSGTPVNECRWMSVIVFQSLQTIFSCLTSQDSWYGMRLEAMQFVACSLRSPSTPQYPQVEAYEPSGWTMDSRADMAESSQIKALHTSSNREDDECLYSELNVTKNKWLKWLIAMRWVNYRTICYGSQEPYVVLIHVNMHGLTKCENKAHKPTKTLLWQTV